MNTFINKFEKASKMQIRSAMFNVEQKLIGLRNTPESIPVLDEEIDNDIEYWQEVHDKLLEMYRDGKRPFN